MDEQKPMNESSPNSTNDLDNNIEKIEKSSESGTNVKNVTNIYPQVIDTSFADSDEETKLLELKNNKEHRNVLEHPKQSVTSPTQSKTNDTKGENVEDEKTSSKNSKVDRTPSWKRKLKKNYGNPNFVHFKRATQEYFEFIHKYHPGDTLPIFGRAKLQLELRKVGLDHVNFVLFGLVGCGKSALLNTLYYTLTGIFKEFSSERKSSREKKAASVTNSRVELRVTESISIIDNRGIDKSRRCFNEVSKQCEGLREGGDMIPPNWNNACSQSLRDSAIRYQKKHLLKHRSHCPIFVFSLREEIHLPTVKRFLEMMKKICYCNPVIVLTFADQANDDKKNHFMETFEDINCARVFCIENYTHDKNDHRLDTDTTAIEILFNCCLVADQSTSTVVNKMNRGSCC